MSTPVVSIVMGSKSDADIMDGAAKILDQFAVPFEMRIISAHRTPDLAVEYGKALKDRGVKIVIAGAGKAAHLPGVIAALTTLPVLGVPMQTSDLGGLDSLLSIVQMPSGVPVATTAIGKHGAKNAGLLAVEILALADCSLAANLDAYRKDMAKAVADDDQSYSGTHGPSAEGSHV